MKKILALILSVAMILSVMPMAMVSAAYSTPTITPPLAHPRVMFTSNSAQTIRDNWNASDNSKAKAYFESLIGDSAFKTSTITKTTLDNSFDHGIEAKIEALAFDYAINGNTDNGNAAVTRWIEYISNVTYTSSVDMVYRAAGATVFHSAEIYDWCYPLMTSGQRNTIRSKTEALFKWFECWNTSTKSPSEQGAIAGHGAENPILRDLLAYSIAIYNEDSSLYNKVMGRIQDEFITPRNKIYESGTVMQGSEYGWYRFYWDLYAELLVERMSDGQTTLFNTDLMKDVCYGMIYQRRTDGMFFTDGDNKHPDYWYYNNFNQQTAKLAGDLFDNAYFKGEYRMMRGTEDFSSHRFNDALSFNAVNWLILNNPDIGYTLGTGGGRNALPKSKYFGGVSGKILATTDWTYQKSNNGVKDSNAVNVEMKIGTNYAANHDHLDAGTFQLYYRGLMTGDYGAEGEYGESFDLNYYKRTVAHNALTIYESTENFSQGTDFFGQSRSNDGGQSSADESNTWSTVLTTAPYNRASVVDHYASDSYSYIKGDLKNAYNSMGKTKAKEVARSMAFLPNHNSNAPATLIVFDKVQSSKASQTKKFLLHTAMEPTVTNNNKVTYDNTKTMTYSNGSTTYAGRLTMNTLLPASATITKIAGCKVGNTTYNPEVTGTNIDNEWGRVEVQAASETDTTRFLNVLTVSDTSTEPADATIIGNENSTLVGAKTAYNQVAMFANTGVGKLSTEASFTVSDGTDLTFYIFGLADGKWTIKKNGEKVTVMDVKNDAGTLSFEGDAGTYSVIPFEAGDLDAAVVAWYDYRLNDGDTYNSSSTIWYDLTETGNDLELPSNATWVDDALKISGSDTQTIALPSAVTDAINGDGYTIEFFATGINTSQKANKTMPLFGNAKSNYAIYRPIDSNYFYLKSPGSKTVLTRTRWNLYNDDGSSLKGLNNHHCIISVDKNNNVATWYIDGQKVTEGEYKSSTATVDTIELLTGAGNVASYKQIKVMSVALNDAEADAEYQAYVAGF